MEPNLTAVYRRVPEGYAAFVEELPGANSQGATLDEARQNLREAVALVLGATRPGAARPCGLSAGTPVGKYKAKVCQEVK